MTALPPPLSELYDGGLTIKDGSVYANFVSSVDGIVAIESGNAPSGGIISGRNEADRFLMGLLRAFADAVLVGAGTVRAEGRRAMWTPDFVFPAGAKAFAGLRSALKRSATPRLVIVTSRGDLDPSAHALQAGTLVLTSTGSADRLRRALPGTNEIRAIADGDRVPVEAVLGVLRTEGLRTILTEGGPHLFGQMVEGHHVDELFLTLSPALAGRRGEQSFGMIHTVDFGRSPRWGQLLSVRRHESHLFLRYALKRTGA